MLASEGSLLRLVGRLAVYKAAKPPSARRRVFFESLTVNCTVVAVPGRDACANSFEGMRFHWYLPGDCRRRQRHVARARRHAPGLNPRCWVKTRVKWL